MPPILSHRWRWWLAGTLTALFLVGVYQIPAVHALVGGETGPGSSVSGQAVQQPFANTNGLTVWYPFDGTPNDSSSNGNNGTLVNSPTYVKGKYGQAINFGGTGYMTPTTLPIASSASAWSFSAWVYPTNLTFGQVLFIETGSATVLELYVNGSGGTNNKGLNLDIFTNANSWTRLASTNTNIVANQWTQVAVTMSGTTATIYTNGVANGSASLQAVPTLTAGTIGGVSAGTDWSGYIDDMRTYNRALSPAEIAQITVGSTPVACDQSCVGWWKLDDGMSNFSATTAVDATGNGHTATLHSFTYDGLTNGWVGGVFGSAVQMSGGTTQSITTNSALPTTANMTVSTWVNPSSSFAAYARIFGTTANGPELGMNSDATVDYGIVNSGGTYSHFTGPKVALHAWSNLTMTLSGEVLKLYINGVLVATQSTTFALSSGTFPTGIGSLSGGTATQIFNGFLDDVRLYNRSLRDYEVAAIYNAGRSS